MSTRELAESILLQALEDVYKTGQRNRSLNFFSTEDFNEWADMAELDLKSRRLLLLLVSRLSRRFSCAQENALSEKPCFVHALVP